MPFRNAALLLLGHGSTLNADSSAPTYQHAEEIRRRGVFAEVHVAFWKEEPNFRQALRQTARRQVYVVPNFISSGYFTEQIIPRELGLTGPVTQIGNQDVFYCQPVGLHPGMTEVLLRSALEVVASSAEKIPDPQKTACLFICGHGTSLNDNSTKIIHEQAEIIRAKKIYADCRAVLMEQRPFVKDWRTLTDCPDVVVVPFFVSDGLHSYEDIPVLLGLTHNIKKQGFTNPHHEKERRLWYANAIGTEPSIADVILDSVAYFNEEHPEARLEQDGLAAPLRIEKYLALLPLLPLAFGQLRIHREKSDTFLLAHEDDDVADLARLRLISTEEEIRDMIRVDVEGHFRPLRAAPNLQRGWCISGLDVKALLLALEYIYPGEAANWSIWNENPIGMATPWRETAGRQTGRFRVVQELNENGVRELSTEVCARGCLKTKLWEPVQQWPPQGRPLPLLCPEACNYFVGKVREKLKGPEEE